MRKRAFAVVSAMTATLTIAGMAIAMMVPGAGTAAPRLAKIDFSTDAAVRSYLDSIGVDPATTVIQRGLNNYAGPRCPGVGWNCTTATSVVQIASGSGTNIYDGNPEFFANGDAPFPVPDSFVTASPPIGTPCTVTQTAVSGQNHARCFQRSTTNPAALTVLIEQTNELGDNFAQVHQQIRQRAGATQMANEDVEVDQNNDAGNNHLHVISQINQVSRETTTAVPPTQTQDADFDALLDQDSETGNNFGKLFQELHQDGTATGPITTVQSQGAEEFGEVDQNEVEEAVILSNGDGQGFSQFFAHQSKSQRLTGPGVQTQKDPARCCGVGSQNGDPQQTFMKILQESDQSASRSNATQSLALEASCDSEGQCEETHHARNNEDSITATNDGTGEVFLTTTCAAAGGEGACDSSDEPPVGD